MCGIAGFLSTAAWQASADPTLWTELNRELRAGGEAGPDWARVEAAVDRLAEHFDQLQSFSVFERVVSDSAAEAALRELAALLDDLQRRASEQIRRAGAEPRLMAVAEKLCDYAWQVREEVVGAVSQVARLAPADPRQLNRSALFVGWSIARVLGSIDRLEVRGRDSLGLSVIVPLALAPALPAALEQDLSQRTALAETVAGRGSCSYASDQQTAFRFVYKVANLVGRIGDNSDNLRVAVRRDALLWHVAQGASGVNLLAHTRWASNGIINVPNCHPVDSSLQAAAGAHRSPDGANVMFVLNGDVDNYRTLLEHTVNARGHAIDPLVSTDAKVLPVLYRLTTSADNPPFDRFVSVLRTAQGSLAVSMQDLVEPGALYVGQKGSGQALYVGATADGWVVASEVYGLAAVCRSCVSMNVGTEGGVALRLATVAQQATLEGRQTTGGKRWAPEPEPIQIFARDIHRGEYEFYIQKEINEAPRSVERTLLGKYRKTERQIEWLLDGFGRGDALLQRLQHAGRQPLRRMVCVGQGTAAIAAMGIAFLAQQALRGAGITVEQLKASEFFGFVGDAPLGDTMVVAVSQSGTTTDTNRIVDLARERGAWVHAIVNRRNSALVQKANSHLYTSSGRDVEMSVASTKAFYSQVAAGKLLALFLADQLGTLAKSQICKEIVQLEALPAKLAEVLASEATLSAVASRLAAGARNWALVGNGANRIAAEEIRIKLSELCYKAIPCDVTEDKKHIDLSTEPLTLVVANDLPEMVVQDTVKEVSIFRAHNGRPIVLCERGETRFDEVAEQALPLPQIGGGLGFVLATMAGHLFGIAAARAIDATAVPFRRIRAHLSHLAEDPEAWNRNALLSQLVAATDSLLEGGADSSLPASLLARFDHHLRWLAAQPHDLGRGDAQLAGLGALNNAIIEELTRPIDTIRHQAKTVTVGISRPVGEISSVILECMDVLGCERDLVPAPERKKLEALSPLITDVTGALLYEVLPAATAGPLPPREWRIQATAGVGTSRVEQSRYQTVRPAQGSKRAALRLGRIVCRPADHPTETGGQIVLPVLGDDGNAIRRLVLFHLTVPPDASLQQKVAILQALDDRYEDLRDRLADQPGLPPVDEVLMRTRLGEVLFAGNDQILSDAAAAAG
jgi:glucosamine--fructose-6-phosphate aminotransferase (isomerizing)